MRPILGSALVCASVIVLAVLVWMQEALFVPAKVALSVFIVTAALWTFTRLNPAWIALVAVMALAATGTTREALVFAMLGHDVVWLMIGAFVMGAAIERTGLAARLAAAVARRARNAGQLFWYTTALLVPFTFLVPSTSGRAATMLPLLKVLPDEAGGALRRAYGLLIPVVILLSTSAALTGAGSHLVLEELLVQRLGDRFGFGNWALWGVPFAIAASVMANSVAFIVANDLRDAH
ncbi:anion permease [Leptolyngbya sp. 15MV]|nr:anion permease [Leptolyngbya sp. 15MV]